MTKWFLLLCEKLSLQLNLAVVTLEAVLMEQLTIGITTACYHRLGTQGTLWGTVSVKWDSFYDVIYFCVCISSSLECFCHENSSFHGATHLHF